MTASCHSKSFGAETGFSFVAVAAVEMAGLTTREARLNDFQDRDITSRNGNSVTDYFGWDDTYYTRDSNS